jgi:hypothetical protein
LAKTDHIHKETVTGTGIIAGGDDVPSIEIDNSQLKRLVILRHKMTPCSKWFWINYILNHPERICQCVPPYKWKEYMRHKRTTEKMRVADSNPFRTEKSKTYLRIRAVVPLREQLFTCAVSEEQILWHAGAIRG